MLKAMLDENGVREPIRQRQRKLVQVHVHVEVFKSFETISATSKMILNILHISFLFRSSTISSSVNFWAVHTGVS